MPGSRSRPRLSCKEHRQLPQTSSINLIAGGKSQTSTPLTLAETSYGKGKNESFSGGLGTSLGRLSTTPFSVCGRENSCLCPHVACKGAQRLREPGPLATQEQAHSPASLLEALFLASGRNWKGNRQRPGHALKRQARPSLTLSCQP